MSTYVCPHCRQRVAKGTRHQCRHMDVPRDPGDDPDFSEAAETAVKVMSGSPAPAPVGGDVDDDCGGDD